MGWFKKIVEKVFDIITAPLRFAMYLFPRGKSDEKRGRDMMATTPTSPQSSNLSSHHSTLSALAPENTVALPLPLALAHSRKITPKKSAAYKPRQSTPLSVGTDRLKQTCSRTATPANPVTPSAVAITPRKTSS